MTPEQRAQVEAALALEMEVWRACRAPAPLRLNLREPHPKQWEFINSHAKRKVIRAGRRGGKTVGVATLAVKRFEQGRRELYATPTQDQFERFWFEVKRALQPDIDSKRLIKNETKHYIEVPGTENRIKAKTAWNADTLRGDYADDLILDEWQLMDEDAWEVVGAPMLLDNDGDAVFVYTPPSIRSAGISKARDSLHAPKLFKRALADTTGRWATFHFSSFDNPYLSPDALAEITKDITRRVYEQEILAEDKDDNPLALWTRAMIEPYRLSELSTLQRIVVAIDPSASSTGAEAGIVAAGVGTCYCCGHADTHGFVLDDVSLQASPQVWATAAVTLYNKLRADGMVAEQNNGGEMVQVTVSTVPGAPFVKLLHASRGKMTRAEPIAALYEQGKVHHVGTFSLLEDEMCQYDGTGDSPNRYDAMVWGLTELLPAIRAGAPALTAKQRAEEFVNQGITVEQAERDPYAAMSREIWLKKALRKEERSVHYDVLGDAMAQETEPEEVWGGRLGW